MTRPTQQARPAGPERILLIVLAILIAGLARMWTSR